MVAVFEQTSKQVIRPRIFPIFHPFFQFFDLTEVIELLDYLLDLADDHGAKLVDEYEHNLTDISICFRFYNFLLGNNFLWDLKWDLAWDLLWD